MEHCLRWYGPSDPVSLSDVRQTGATGIVTALHHVPNGEAWTEAEIQKRQREIHDGSPDPGGLRWSVVESVPVHEDIKRGCAAPRLFDNYRATLRRLAACDVRTVCYNFMPVLDWTRTDLEHRWFDGSTALRFETELLAVFDLFLLRRPGAEHSYTEDTRAAAERRFSEMTGAQQERLAATVAAGLPGSEESWGTEELRAQLELYEGLQATGLRDNLVRFLEEVVPTAEEVGVRLAIHPDDPPVPLLGLPRVVSNGADLSTLLDAVESPANGLTFCVGSLGAGQANDVEDLARTFAGRTHFVHLRNVKRGTHDGDFVEADHLDGDTDMVQVIAAMLREEEASDRSLPMRPDHGHALMDDLSKEARPGYTAIGRLRGLAELRGVERALQATGAFREAGS